MCHGGDDGQDLGRSDGGDALLGQARGQKHRAGAGGGGGRLRAHPARLVHLPDVVSDSYYGRGGFDGFTIVWGGVCCTRGGGGGVFQLAFEM